VLVSALTTGLTEALLPREVVVPTLIYLGRNDSFLPWILFHLILFLEFCPCILAEHSIPAIAEMEIVFK
jgi:hypothetical protein